MQVNRPMAVIRVAAQRLPVLGWLPAVLLLAAVAGCGEKAGPELSFEEYCAMGHPAISNVTAQARDHRVIVKWQENFEAREDRSFRVYRREGGTDQWVRVAQLTFGAHHERKFVDPSPRPPSSLLAYGVTELHECGETSICVGEGQVQQCGIATVRRDHSP